MRAASILVVVLGHWLMAAPRQTPDNGYELFSMLSIAPSSQYLSWVLQVMPVFFFVGGYSNGASWDASRRDSHGYAHWLGARLNRLLGPMLLLIAFWAALGAAALTLGTSAELLQTASRVALVPTWFLAVYVAPVVLVPLTRALWNRHHMATFWILCALAGVNDWVFFGAGIEWLGWANYLLVWVAVHQLGYAWRDGYFEPIARRVSWCIVGFALLAALVELGPWPRSLVGVPGENPSNTTPPKIPLLALAMFQIGVVTLVEPWANRWLSRLRPWSITVLINATIMTIFLWHSTLMILLFGASVALGGFGLHAEPGSGVWWGARLLWITVFAAGMLPVVAMLSRFERASVARPDVASWRLLSGATIVCAGLAMLALNGVNAVSPPMLHGWALLLPFIGAEIAGFGPVSALWRRSRRLSPTR